MTDQTTITQDRRSQKTIWDILPLIAMLGSGITVWVNLNSELTQVQIQQEYAEKFNSVKVADIEKEILSIREALAQMEKGDKEIREQLADIERMVTHLYSKKR